MAGEKVALTGVDARASLLVTFYSKVLDSRAASSILSDKLAEEAASRLDFDFTKLKLPKDAAISVPVRAKHLDQWTREFLAAHPSATVLHVGCGLDSRVYRIDPPPTVRWYDVDLPEVIALRMRLYPERAGVALVGTSVTDLRWLDGIAADRPVLMVAEGLVMYLTKRDGLALFNRITKQFTGGQLIFDAYSRLMVRSLTLLSPFLWTGVSLSWAINDPRTLEKDVRRLKLVTAVPFLTLPELTARLNQAGWQRLIARTLLRKAVQHLRYQF